jgi:hypothetical protein
MQKMAKVAKVAKVAKIEIIEKIVFQKVSMIFIQKSSQKTNYSIKRNFYVTQWMQKIAKVPKVSRNRFRGG